MATYTITPMVVAKGPQREKSRFTYMHGCGEKVDIPYTTWLIQGNGINALVDTGCSAADYREHIRSKDKPLVYGGEKFNDVEEIKPLAQHLKERGLGVDDIDMVLQTHVDWDHCMNTRHFKKSKILIQRTEWAKLPVHPLFKSTYAPNHIYAEMDKLNLQFLDGDHHVANGLDLIYTPGHSPGGQSVVVNTANGRYVIAGMCTIRENFFPSEETKAITGLPVIPTGSHMDPFQVYDSMLRIMKAGDHVLPFHDSANFTMGRLG